MNKEFTRFFKKAILFLLFFVAFDLIIGQFTKEIFYSQKTGKYARVTDSIYNDDSDVLIMGSSHANRHYNPEVLEEELGMTCFNAGVQGQYLIFHTALLKMILENHKPELIILNVDDWWMTTSDDAYERLAALHPYYWNYREELEPILSMNSRFINIKLLSKAYQTNSTIVHVIKYALRPQKDYHGYIPLHDKMTPPEKSREEGVTLTNNGVIDDNFVFLFEDFIKTTQENNVDLVLVHSPRSFEIDRNKFYKESFHIMKSIASEYDVPLIDFTNHESFTEHYDLFNDPGHLNNDGAILFSKLVGEKVKEELDSKSSLAKK